MKIGKQIVQLQASLATLQEVPRASKKVEEDPYGRFPFQHAALEGLDALGSSVKTTRMNKRRIAALARQYGLEDVLRWVPKDVRWTPFLFHSILTTLTDNYVAHPTFGFGDWCYSYSSIIRCGRCSSTRERRTGCKPEGKGLYIKTSWVQDWHFMSPAKTAFLGGVL